MFKYYISKRLHNLKILIFNAERKAFHGYFLKILKHMLQNFVKTIMRCLHWSDHSPSRPIHLQTVDHRLLILCISADHALCPCASIFLIFQTSIPSLIVWRVCSEYGVVLSVTEHHLHKNSEFYIIYLEMDNMPSWG